MNLRAVDNALGLKNKEEINKTGNDYKNFTLLNN